jgi:acetyl esterase/lipase
MMRTFNRRPFDGRRLTALFLIFLFYCGKVGAQQVVPLYKNVPNSIPTDTVREQLDTTANGRVLVRKVNVPALTVFLPAKDKANGAAVIICPGGGYSYLVINREGTDVAEEFVKKGVTAFVLKYRLPSDVIMTDKSIGPLQDVQQAIKIVRERAADWNINVSKIGVMGFSAGGHLASSAATHFNRPVIENKNNTSLRPDFSILVYPVISFSDSLAHKGSRRALLGKDTASAERVQYYSNEKQVSSTTPPAFLLHAGDDKVVLVNNSISYYQSLIRFGVKAELMIYPNGGHGFGLTNKSTTDQWLERCFNWMADNKWIR